jgi:hypothetical protein
MVHFRNAIKLHKFPTQIKGMLFVGASANEGPQGLSGAQSVSVAFTASLFVERPPSEVR